MADNEAGEDQSPSRLGSFMDCVFSIAITLPIVQLTPPTVGPGLDLAGAYRQLAPQFVAYLLDFAVIGLFWNYSHFGSKLLKRTDHGYNLLTPVFLACVSLTPVPARPWVDHARDPANARAAALVYGSALAAPTAVWFIHWYWGISRGLYHPELSRRYVRAMTARYAGGDRVRPGRRRAALLRPATASFLLPPSRPFHSDGGPERMSFGRKCWTEPGMKPIVNEPAAPAATCLADLIACSAASRV